MLLLKLGELLVECTNRLRRGSSNSLFIKIASALHLGASIPLNKLGQIDLPQLPGVRKLWEERQTALVNAEGFFEVFVLFQVRGKV